MNTCLPPNTLLQSGRYKIIRFISSGGFGCTYEAEHVKLGKKVAIKEFFVKDFCNRDESTAQVSVGTSSKKGLVQRLETKFLDEARALSELNHPGIVRVTDVFEENNTSYFVMDFVDGKSLNDIVKSRGVLPENLAVQFIRQAAMALKYVHKHNRLHLDIKPGNIMVNQEGKAILIDFGASKQYDEVDGENTSTLLGKTPGYAPIEQMGNDVVQFTPSTDIYALGGTLYKLLTAKTPRSSTLRVSGDELDPLPNDISQPVRNAVYAAMELNKNKRPQSIEEFLAILDGGDEDTQAPINDPEAFMHDVVNVHQPAAAANQQPPQQEISYNSEVADEGKKKKNIILAAIGSIAALAVVVVLLVVFNNKTAEEAANVNQNESVTPKQVVDSVYILNDDEQLKYTGPVNSQNQPHGKGHGIYKASDYEGDYQGEYKNGLRDGEGVFIYKSSDGSAEEFTGTFEADYYKKGRIVDSKTKNYFEGEFVDGAPYNGTNYNKFGQIKSKVTNGVER